MNWRAKCVLSVFIVLAAVVVGWSVNEAHAPLEGETHIELGPLRISTGFHEMEHAFVLQNTSRRAVTIVRMTASCGCVEITSDRRDVRPGEDVRITMRFDLDPGGVQFYRGFVHLSDESVVPLSITVRGQRASQLSTAVPIAVVGGEAAVVELQYVAYELNASAPQLAIDGPEGLSLQVGSWRQVGYLDSGAGSPSRWFTTLTIGPWNDRSVTGEASQKLCEYRQETKWSRFWLSGRTT